jgi:hypothetical protein
VPHAAAPFQSGQVISIRLLKIASGVVRVHPLEGGFWGLGILSRKEEILSREDAGRSKSVAWVHDKFVG